MIKITLNGRTAEVEIDHSGAACDAMVASGNYTDGNMEDLTDSELDKATEENPEKIAEYCMESDGYWKE